MDKENPAKPSNGSSGNEAGRLREKPSRSELKAQIKQAVEAFQGGQDREKSFRFLFETFYDPTRFFLAKRVSSQEDCLDLTQETFLRVYKGLEGYRGEAQFGTWVFRIAFNTYLKWLSRNRIDDQSIDSQSGIDELEAAWEDDELIVVASDETPLEKTLRTERRRVLKNAIEELPGQMRRCTELRIYHDLSYREIAVVMRRSIETVKVHLFQSRKKLKESFGDVEI